MIVVVQWCSGGLNRYQAAAHWRSSVPNPPRGRRHTRVGRERRCAQLLVLAISVQRTLEVSAAAVSPHGSVAVAAEYPPGFWNVDSNTVAEAQRISFSLETQYVVSRLFVMCCHVWEQQTSSHLCVSVKAVLCAARPCYR